MANPLEAAADLLRSTVERRGLGYAACQQKLGRIEGGAGVLQLAVTQAVHEMMWTSTAAGFDEEHHTASLMGHLASNIGWYALLHRWSLPPDPDPDQELAEPPQLHWAYQGRHREAAVGADFGLAIRAAGDKVRIALFQAKSVQHGQQADVFRPPRGNGARAIADASLEELRSEELLAKRLEGELQLTPCESAQRHRNRHQLHKLAACEALGRARLARRSNAPPSKFPVWAHYVFWHQHDGASGSKPAAPTLRTVRNVVKDVLARSEAGATVNLAAPNPRLVEWRVKAAGRDFIDFVASGFHDGGDGWLVVSGEEARTLLGPMAPLLPPLLLGDDTGKGGSTAFWEHVFNRPEKKMPERYRYKVEPVTLEKGDLASMPRPEIPGGGAPSSSFSP